MAPRKPPAPPPAAAPTHLAASMRVVASHSHMRHIPVADAKKEVIRAAELHAEGLDLPENARLVAKLEKVTGASIDELAVLAKGWPEA